MRRGPAFAPLLHAGAVSAAGCLWPWGSKGLAAWGLAAWVQVSTRTRARVQVRSLDENIHQKNVQSILDGYQRTRDDRMQVCA